MDGGGLWVWKERFRCAVAAFPPAAPRPGRRRDDRSCRPRNGGNARSTRPPRAAAGPAAGRAATGPRRDRAISPLRSSTFRCLVTAGALMRKGRVRSFTDASPRASRAAWLRFEPSAPTYPHGVSSAAASPGSSSFGSCDSATTAALRARLFRPHRLVGPIVPQRCAGKALFGGIAAARVHPPPPHRADHERHRHQALSNVHRANHDQPRRGACRCRNHTLRRPARCGGYGQHARCHGRRRPAVAPGWRIDEQDLGSVAQPRRHHAGPAGLPGRQKLGQQRRRHAVFHQHRHLAAAGKSHFPSLIVGYAKLQQIGLAGLQRAQRSLGHRAFIAATADRPCNPPAGRYGQLAADRAW